MALVHRSRTTSTAAAANMIAAPSPPSPALPPPPVDPWGTNSSLRAFISDLTAVVLVLVCFSFVARRAAAREVQGPKPTSDADAVSSASASPVVAGMWAEAECAICLTKLELDPEESGERVRVLPACGHGFHAACVEAWLATRASCPTCRALSQSRPSRTTRQP